ncbi:MAG: hypothetical protein WDN46_16400 [Methylocella sp.]
MSSRYYEDYVTVSLAATVKAAPSQASNGGGNSKQCLRLVGSLLRRLNAN